MTQQLYYLKRAIHGYPELTPNDHGIGEPVLVISGSPATIIKHGQPKKRVLVLLNYAARTWYGWTDQDNLSKRALNPATYGTSKSTLAEMLKHWRAYAKRMRATPGVVKAGSDMIRAEPDYWIAHDGGWPALLARIDAFTKRNPRKRKMLTRDKRGRITTTHRLPHLLARKGSRKRTRDRTRPNVGVMGKGPPLWVISVKRRKSAPWSQIAVAHSAASAKALRQSLNRAGWYVGVTPK